MRPISSTTSVPHSTVGAPRGTQAVLAGSAHRWAPLLIVVLALLLRLAAALHFPLHADESESLLAMRGVAAHGVPVFPSGTLFLHGATLSYLLAPLVWFGWGELDDLFLLRAVNTVLGALAVYLTYRLARAVVGSTAPALLAAALVALDPLSIEWGALLRMYALEQALAVAITWLFIRQVVPEAGTVARSEQRRELAGLVVAFWLAVFAHLSVALLWPAMAAAAVLLYGHALLDSRRGLSVALGLCLPAPLVLVAASTVWGATLRDPSLMTGSPVAAAFVGEQHLNLGHILAPDLEIWAGLFNGVALAGLMPVLVAALSGLLTGRYLLLGSSDGKRTRRSIAAVLLLYWVPVLVFAAIAAYAHSRYLLFLQPLGAILMAAALATLAGREGQVSGSVRTLRLVRAGVVGLALLLLVDLGGGVLAGEESLMQRRRPDPTLAYRYVAAHHAPGEPILVSWPPVAYLVLGDSPDLHYLIDERWVLGRYTQTSSDERWTDLFVGIEVVPSVADLCELLASHPGSWVVGDLINKGDMPEESTWNVVKGAAEEVFRTAAGVPVFRSVAPTAWQRTAVKRCEPPGAADTEHGGNATH